MPTTLRNSFGKDNIFLPVIHLPDEGRHGIDAIRVALDAGADGVFLINQGASSETILHRLIPTARAEFGPSLWVGVNFLGWEPEEVMRKSGTEPEKRLDGIWSDDAGVDALDASAFEVAKERFLAARNSAGWKGLYFGGTAFKTQHPIPSAHLPTVARRAATFMDVVTTSGPGTGLAATPEKIAAIRRAIPDTPLGLASGVTPENVYLFLGAVQAFLVATGIERSFGFLDPIKTEKLSSAIHEFDRPEN